jgi:hypothetical protein
MAAKDRLLLCPRAGVGWPGNFTEISHKEEDLGQFADKHQFMVGYHGRTYDQARTLQDGFFFTKYNGTNVDINIVAGSNVSPVPFIKQHHERITHLRERSEFHDGPNTPFGGRHAGRGGPAPAAG